MHLVLLLWVSVLSVYGSPNLYDEGKKIYFAKGCNGCHGVDAKGSSAYPSLAYRRKAFLSNKLHQYRKKIAPTQQAEMMVPFAQQLSDRQIDALTTYFSEYREEKSQYKQDHTTRGDGGS